MANEVRYTTSYSFSNDGQTAGLTNTVNYSVTGSGRMFEQTITVNNGQNRALTFGDLANVSHLCLKNLNVATGNLSFSTNAAQTGNFLIPPGASMFVLPTSTGLWVSGQVMNVTLAYSANEG